MESVGVGREKTMWPVWGCFVGMWRRQVRYEGQTRRGQYLKDEEGGVDESRSGCDRESRERRGRDHHGGMRSVKARRGKRRDGRKEEEAEAEASERGNGQ